MTRNVSSTAGGPETDADPLQAQAVSGQADAPQEPATGPTGGADRASPDPARVSGRSTGQSTRQSTAQPTGRPPERAADEGQARAAEAGDVVDLLVIGGGINGTGIARDAAGRGFSVCLAEKDDLAAATSSASTKLFHGGLRYLEYFEFDLVRKALVEREVLLRAMPHISWPLRFVLPYHPDMRFEGDTPASRLLTRVMPWMKGRRPAWLIRLGLFLYDHLGGRKILPPTRTLDLRRRPEGVPLQDRFETACEYSDCWVEDSRLVVLNARDAAERGAEIRTGCEVTGAEARGDHWAVALRDTGTGARTTRRARMLVNAAGPWVGEILHGTLRLNTPDDIRLVRGSHIVTRRLYDHDKAYFFQGTDGRIIFAIPYEGDFTLIGTTDQEHGAAGERPEITEGETRYLLDFASSYFREPVTEADIVWSYSGVRPLYDDGATSATAATRDYVLKVERVGAAPVLNVFGGKITTYRKLAEGALDRIAREIGARSGAAAGGAQAWTAGVALPGGDFPVRGAGRLAEGLRADYPFLTERWAWRLVRAYGTEARAILGSAARSEDLGEDFGATLTAAEVDWLMTREFARGAADVLWRRSKLGLRLTEAHTARLEAWMAERRLALAAAE